MVSQDVSLLASVDARTKLAGSNKMEILLFSLGTRETFGINVFKVREVSQTPEITKSPNMPFGVEGVISLRGNINPIISLGKFIGAPGAAGRQYDSMIVTEFNKSTQAFLVDSVDRIIRIDWEKMRAPDAMMTSGQAMITAVSELEDGKLVAILDGEQIRVLAVEEFPEAFPHAGPQAVHIPGYELHFVSALVALRSQAFSLPERLGLSFCQTIL